MSSSSSRRPHDRTRCLRCIARRQHRAYVNWFLDLRTDYIRDYNERTNRRQHQMGEPYFPIMHEFEAMSESLEQVRLRSIRYCAR